MKITHEYCDCCGKQMTYQDADGHWCTNGIKLEEPIKVALNIRTGWGSSGFLKEMHEDTFCGNECFLKTVSEFVKSVCDSRSQDEGKPAPNYPERLAKDFGL